MLSSTAAALSALFLSQLARASPPAWPTPSWGPPSGGPWGSHTWPSMPGPSATPSPTSTCPARTAIYSTFSYTQLSTDRYATPLSSPVNYGTTFAPPYAQASTLLAPNITTTTYSYNPAAASSDDGPYGQSAYNELWASLNYTFAPLPFTTTVSPTPVATSELVAPPALYSPCPAVADECLDCFTFPADFMWGTSTSAYQIEGGLQWEGRGPSSEDGNGVGTAFDGNVDQMEYWYYKQDIVRLAAMGLPWLAFSISWTRIIPFGVAGSPVNLEAIQHYRDKIDFCNQNGIKIIVTLCHYDRPAFVSADTDEFVDAFLYYSKIVMTEFGADVPVWLTFNEPNLRPSAYFENNAHGATNVLLAHAQVYHWYKEVLGGTAQISMKFAHNLAIPQNYSSATDIQAAQRYNDFLVGIYANPLFLGINYPAEVLNTTGFNQTALSADQISYIHGTMDFWSWDPYSAQFVTATDLSPDCPQNISDPNWPWCAPTTEVQLNGWLLGNAGWYYQYIAPQYVRQQFGYIWNTYRPAGMVIAEFGFQILGEADKTLDEQRYDLDRSLYYQYFLKEVLKAIHIDNINVIGALAWTAVDDNEFGDVTQRFGLQTVNRTLALNGTTGDFARHYKRSFFDYVDFFHKYVAAS